MTDNPYAFEGRVDLDPEQAWEIYRDLPEPTAKECARILQERGVKVSYDTIARWARRGKWRERVEQLRAIAGVGCPKDLAAALKLEAELITPEHLQGLQHRLVARMAQQINEMPLTTPADFEVMVGVLEKLDAVIHHHRGNVVGGARGGNGSGAVVIDRFQAFKAARERDLGQPRQPQPDGEADR